MSIVFRLRRGRKTLMKGPKAGNLVLKEGEMFIEYPDEGIGKDPRGSGVGIKIGDGITRYRDLPYYLQEQGEIYELLEAISERIDNISLS